MKNPAWEILKSKEFWKSRGKIFAIPMLLVGLVAFWESDEDAKEWYK